MRRCFAQLGVATLGFAALAALGPAQGRPMDGMLQKQLLGVYSQYNRAVAAGHLDEALSLRSGAARQGLAQQLASPKSRADY
jgi:hypothetical protein